MSELIGKLALIIEDDLTSIAVLQQMLENVGVEADVVTDSFKIADRLHEVERPDVVFLDLEMPQANGYTVLEYLQQNPKFDGTPIVAYTTHISHLNDAKRAGFHSFLGKPLDGRLFRDQLTRILNNIPVWEVP